MSYLTKERYEELERELAILKGERRREIADRLKQAKELGDLSENSEYQEAKEEQVRVEQNINQLEQLLKYATIIKKATDKSVISVGSRVKLKKSREIVSYTIVGSNEARPAEGFISNESPIGKGLLGKKIGDRLEVKTPNGNISYEVLNIE